MRQSQEGRALRQFTLSTGKSAGRNSSGRITVFHRGVAKESGFVRQRMHFFSFSFPSLTVLKLHLFFSLSGVGLGPRDLILFRLPQLRLLPFSIRIFIYVVVQLLFLFFIAHISRSVFLLLMDDLSRAVSQFYPSAPGGMSGGFSAPPTPPGHSGFFGLIDQSVNETEMEQDRGTSSNTGSENRADEIARLLNEKKYEKALTECQNKRQEILDSDLFKRECERAGRAFPQTAPILSKEDLLNKVLNEVINGKGRSGMNPGADIKELRAYKSWLSRICRTLAEEEKYQSGGYPKIQTTNRDAHILHHIAKIYEKWNDQVRNG